MSCQVGHSPTDSLPGRSLRLYSSYSSLGCPAKPVRLPACLPGSFDRVERAGTARLLNRLRAEHTADREDDRSHALRSQGAQQRKRWALRERPGRVIGSKEQARLSETGDISPPADTFRQRTPSRQVCNTAPHWTRTDASSPQMGEPSPTRQHSRSSSHFASNLILSPVSGTAPQLPSAADSPAADASRRPKAGEHVQRRRSAPFGPDLIREPPSPPPWQAEPRGREGEGEAPGDDDGSRTPSLPPTDPSTPAQSSFPSTSNSLAQFIQTKRRQASAPYFASARSQSLFSPGAGFSLGRDSSDAVSSPQTTTATTSDLPAAAPRNRSRASSRRATATGGLPQLRTQGLESFAQIAQHDAGLVPTPTIEEWRQLGSDLADMRMKAEQEEQEQGAGGEARHASPPRPKPKWKRWPSLHDDSDDSDDEGESSGGDQAEDFRLSLSLSALGQHQLPHTPPPGAGPEAPKKSYKSSFAYSSSGFGSTGGFVSHSNTRSLGGLSSASSPEPDSAQGVFEPTHDGAGQKGDPTLALSTTEVNVQSMTHLSRPSLSRGSLSTATGGLSTPSPPRSGDSETETGSVGSVPPPATAVAAAEETTQKPRDGLPRVPLPPRVYRSLETGEPGSSTSSTSATSSTTSLSDDVFPSGAPTPFDGDPFASSAPAGTAVPPTPHFGEHVPGGEPPEGAPHPQRDGAGTGDVQAVDLDWTKPLGPVDPRTYSAVTGLRDIRSFVCEEEEAGKGAYGSVRRARERGPDGKPVGVSRRPAPSRVRTVH